MDLVSPDCPPLHVQSSADSSHLFSMFTTADSGAAASAQRRMTRSDHPRQCLIYTETTELAQWPSDTTRQLFRPGLIPLDAGKISPNFLPLPLLTCGSPLSSTHTTSNTCQNFVPRFSVFRTLDIVWASFENSILIRLQRIYNLWSIHAVILSTLDV